MYSLDGVKYGIAAIDGDFQLRRHRSNHAYCYFLRRGTLELEIYQPHPCQFIVPEGVIICVSGLIPHTFRSLGYRLTPRISDHEIVELHLKNHSRETELIIGSIEEDAQAFVSAYFGLQVITESNSPIIFKRIWDTYALIESEICQNALEAQEIVRLLSQTIMLNVSRFISDASAIKLGALPSIMDHRVVKTLLAIGRDPCRNWTVAALAEIAAMSRTSFAKHFNEVLGTTPMKAVRYARVTRALHALETSDEPVERIAEICGYASATAFARAFQSEIGVSPSKWRIENSSAGRQATA